MLIFNYTSGFFENKTFLFFPSDFLEFFNCDRHLLHLLHLGDGDLVPRPAPAVDHVSPVLGCVWREIPPSFDN